MRLGAVLLFVSSLAAQTRELIQTPAPAPASPPDAVEFEGEEGGCTGSMAPEARTWWYSESDRFWLRPPLTLDPGERAAIVADLRGAMARTTDPEAAAGLLVARCAIGREESDAVAARDALHAKEPILAATAGVALGLTRAPDVIPTLLAVFADSARPVRPRAWAAYGVALALEGNVSLGVQADVLRVAAARLQANDADPDLDVAAVFMLRALRPGHDRALLDAALGVLWAFHDRPDVGRVRARAHVASAIARLSAPGGDPGGFSRQRLCAALARGDDRHEWPLGVGAAQALGALCEGQPCPEVEAALTAHATRGRNRHVSGMARLALGRIGSDDAVRGLLAELGGHDGFVGAWAATGLGWAARSSPVLEVARREEVRAALLARLPDHHAHEFDVYLLALGLSGHQGAAGVVSDAVRARAWSRHTCVSGVEALALLRAPEAVDAARGMAAVARGDRFEDLMRVRARLGDPTLVADLRAHLHPDQRNLVLLAGSLRALGEAGAAGLGELRAALASSSSEQRELAADALLLAVSGGSPLAAMHCDHAYRFAPLSLGHVWDGLLSMW